MPKLRVLYVLCHYPQMSETYIKSEIEAVNDDCDIGILCVEEADLPYKANRAYTVCRSNEEMVALARRFDPDVLHTHWLVQVPLVASLAGCDGRMPLGRRVPFTVRAHSFDVLGEQGKQIRQATSHLNDELCLGVLTFPFTCDRFLAAGVELSKIHGSPPVVDVAKFFDRSPNGDAVMNVGACLPKKRMQDFIALAMMVPGRSFNLYALGYEIETIRTDIAKACSPVHLIPPVEPDDMPREYKRHEWLVYTAEMSDAMVGWPMSVAEAQAAGVGVCVPNVRPDIREYIGPSGFVYDSIADVIKVISAGYPHELREQGFATAWTSDIRTHKATLLQLWDNAMARG